MKFGQWTDLGVIGCKAVSIRIAMMWEGRMDIQVLSSCICRTVGQ